jgi:hypothetical protein
MCLEATDGCNVGICDPNGSCLPMPVADGTACNDYNSCTGTDTCTAGDCAGVPVAGCTLYFTNNFEAGCPPGGFTLGGDWECGTPTGPGPGAAFGGQYCIATQIDGNYSNGQSYTANVAQTPPIDLGTAIDPVLQFAGWIQTESCCDGANVKISTNGGSTFTVLSPITPAYNLSISAEPAWGNNTSFANWQTFSASLAAYVGQTIILRFSVRTDGSVVYPGMYVDNIIVSEVNAIPLDITTPATLPDALSTYPYLVQLQKTGGTAAAVWSIVGGMNHGWLSINPTTGALSGTPGAANAGPFSVTVHVEEPALPSNFDEQVFTGSVTQALYVESFEGAGAQCANGWTFGGDWECGTPVTVGPATAFEGVKCIGTQIDANYSNNQLFTTAVATSPPISLAGTTTPLLTFRMWNQTEGSVYDGANLKVSTDGVSFTQVMNVNPAYNVSIGEQAWGGLQSALGWQIVTADLTAYAGQTIYLRYAFKTDGSVVYPGIYIDQLVIAD